MIFPRLKIFLDEIRKHGSLRQLRYFLRWRRSLRVGSGSVKDRQPWITFPAIDFLKRHLDKTHRVFEYGGGGSSLFFADRVSELITVEHNFAWYNALQIENPKHSNWKLFLVESEKGTLVTVPEPAVPAHYASADQGSSDLNFRNYASFIDRFEDSQFDCVLIDGRARPSCLMHALPKVKSGGLIIMDNTERKYYTQHFSDSYGAQLTVVLNGIAPGPYSQEFTETTIWRKK